MVQEIVEFNLIGMDKVEMALKKFPRKIAVEAVRKALRAGAKILLEEAKARVPVDTGNLRASLGIKTIIKTKNAGIAMAIIGPRVSSRGRRRGFTRKIRNDGWYAHLVEYGSRTKTGRLAPRPFMRTALDTKGDAAIRETTRIIDQEVKRITKELAR